MASNSQATGAMNIQGGMTNSQATRAMNPVNSAPLDPAAEAARILKEAQAEYDELLLIETITEDAQKKVDQQKKLRNLLKAMNAIE